MPRCPSQLNARCVKRSRRRAESEPTRLWRHIGGKHVCPVRGVARVRLDEERYQGRAVCLEALVVANEKATRVRCRQLVEGTRYVCLAVEARAVICRLGHP